MTDVEKFFGENGPLAREFPGYAPRQQQIDLSNAIAGAIEKRTPLFGEAPTGVGKSFAALVPAFQLIKKEDAPVIVVTSSIILQEQYFYKDVPFLEKLFGMNTNAVLLKGKSNYVCLHKAINNKATGTTTSQVEELSELHEWASTTKTGDMSELDFTPSYGAWSEMAIVDEHECGGKDCPLFSLCHYYTRRRQMMSSKLIICNYHYFFTALKSEKMLPPNIRVVILDEGHEISSIARDMQEKSYNMFTYKKLNQMLASTQKKVKGELGDIPIADEIQLMGLLESLRLVMEATAKYYYEKKPADKEKWTLRDTEKLELQRLGQYHLAAVQDTFDLLVDYIEKYGLPQDMRGGWEDYYTDLQVEWQYALERYLDGLAERLLLAKIFFQDPEHQLPKDVLLWLEPLSESAVTLRLKPTNAAPITRTLFLDHFNSERPPALLDATPIVISATLSVNKRFEHIKGDLGVTKRVEEITVSSPFDLNKNLLWYLPENMPAGNEAGHLPVVLNEMETIIRTLEGRTLCLFTSNKSLQAAALHFRKMLPRDIEVIAQGELPKQKIIDRIRDYPNSVVLATRSFFTGVDVQGQNISAVLIDKLPFPMIGDPVNDWLMSGPNGFYAFTLPETVISMKQGFGRLNRTTNDRGVVAVFDGRLSTGKYKTHIFNSFDFAVNATRDKGVVKTYLEEILNELNR
jgi:ATP-dependent DNA helicase DinG